MNTRSFARTLFFGALAGLGTGAFVLLGGPAGGGAALVVATLLLVPTYAASLGRTTAERGRAFGIALALVAAVAIFFATRSGDPGDAVADANAAAEAVRQERAEQRRAGSSSAHRAMRT